MTLPPPNDDRETLSALFDGELRGDAARFALKRLDHDRTWGESLGRWQLAGDVLRGRSDAAAPADFAVRVQSALAADARMDTLPAVAANAGGSRRIGGWMPGAALAASVAVAALFVARPFDEPAPALETASSTVAAAPAPVDVPPSQPGDTVVDGDGSPAAALAGAAIVAAAERPRREAQRQLVAATPGRGDSGVMEAAAAGGSAPQPGASDLQRVATAEVSVQPGSDPFQPRAAEFGARPWPRAVLTDYRVGGAMTASYGAPAAASSPSFYPFEPRIDAETRPAAPLPAAEAGLGDAAEPVPPSP